MKDKISVILPVYNADQYLRECLDSLINQTYDNIEIICVNDGSTDNSLQILNEYKHKDDRIKVISIENSGVSNARNVAIKNATGDYFTFCDSDDWVDLDFCKTLYDVAIIENADVVNCAYISENNNKSFKRQIFNEEYLIFEKEEVKKFVHRRLFGLLDKEMQNPERGDSIATLWTKLIKRDIALKAEFCDLKEIGVFEDGLFLIDVLPFCQKFVYINKPLYHYRKTNSNSITTRYKKNLYKCLQNLYDKIGFRIKQNNYDENYSRALNNRICFSMIGLGFNALKNNAVGVCKKSEELKGILNTERYETAFNELDFKWLSKKWKVFFWLCKTKKTIMLVFLLRIMNFLRRRIAK